MSNFKYLPAILITVIFIFNSCNKSSNPVDSPGVNEVNGLVPLKVGNCWIYKFTTYDSSGTTLQVDTITYVIKSDTMVNGTKWYLMESENLFVEGTSGLRNDGSGYYATDFQFTTRFYPYPSPAGTWLNPITLLAVDSLIETNTEAFSCYVYRDDSYRTPSIQFYAPGTGLIYEENYFKSLYSNNIYLAGTSELISFITTRIVE